MSSFVSLAFYKPAPPCQEVREKPNWFSFLHQTGGFRPIFWGVYQGNNGKGCHTNSDFMCWLQSWFFNRCAICQNKNPGDTFRIRSRSDIHRMCRWGIGSLSRFELERMTDSDKKADGIPGCNLMLIVPIRMTGQERRYPWCPDNLSWTGQIERWPINREKMSITR